MSLILRFRGVPHAYDALLRTAIESALDGDWCVTLSRSHLDGQWHLQLDGETQRCRVVLPELEKIRITGLIEILRGIAADEDRWVPHEGVRSSDTVM